MNIYEITGEIRKTCKGCHNLNNSPTKWWCDVRGKKTNGHPKQICIRGFEDKIDAPKGRVFNSANAGDQRREL